MMRCKLCVMVFFFFLHKWGTLWMRSYSFFSQGTFRLIKWKRKQIALLELIRNTYMLGYNEIVYVFVVLAVHVIKAKCSRKFKKSKDLFCGLYLARNTETIKTKQGHFQCLQPSKLGSILQQFSLQCHEYKITTGTFSEI